MKRTIALVLLILAGFPGLNVARGQDPAAAAYRAAHDLILDGKWAAAREKLQVLLQRFPKSDYAEESAYYLCVAREKLGEAPGDMYACYAEFIARYPNGTWAKQAVSNLMMQSMRARWAGANLSTVPFVLEKTTAGEDAEVARIFTLQGSDSAAAFREAARLYDSTRSTSLRGKLVYVLGSFRTPEAVSKLAEIMQSEPSPAIRSDALILLANTRLPEAFAYLRRLVDSDAPTGLRVTAFRRLLQNNPPGADTLYARLAIGENQEIAENAASGLASMGWKVETKTFQNLLAKAKYPRVRETAFFALVGLSRHALSGTALRRIAERDRDPIIRFCAKRLTSMSSDSVEAAEAIIELASSGSSGSDLIIGMLARTYDESAMREFLTWNASIAPQEHLASVAFQGLKMLLGKGGGKEFGMVAVYSKYTEIRKSALREIAGSKASVPISALDSVLHRDSDAGVRFEAIQALAVQPPDSARAPMLNAAQNDRDLSVRTAAAAALQRMGAPGTAEGQKTPE